MSEQGSRGGRRGGRRGRGRGRGRGGGGPSDTTSVNHGRQSGAFNRGNHEDQFGASNGVYNGYHPGGGHIQHDWSSNQTDASYGGRGQFYEEQSFRSNGYGPDPHAHAGPHGRGGHHSHGGRYQNQGDWGQYGSDREGRARALEELRGVLVEQQGYQQERRNPDHNRGIGNSSKGYASGQLQAYAVHGQSFHNQGQGRHGQEHHKSFNEIERSLNTRRGEQGWDSTGEYARAENEDQGPLTTFQVAQQNHNRHHQHQPNGRGRQKEQNGIERRGKRQEEHRGDSGADLASSDIRVRLSAQLSRGVAECLVCLDRIKQVASTWDCPSCYQVFHLSCIKKWSKSAVDSTGGWRCPGCQGVNSVVPTEYRCFCRKQRNPEWNRNENLVPHTCGELCGKARGAGCPHRCAELCHPGRCPPCAATCPCGRESKRQKCGEPLLCGSICEKPLPCGRHTCQLKCHEGPCQPCSVELTQTCHCGASTREVPCTEEAELVFSCGEKCPRMLDCGLHPCTSTCHPGPCSPCKLALDQVTHCPCGQSTLESLFQAGATPRSNCLDPIPVCAERCRKQLSCGPPSAPHTCALPCHVGSCPPCPLSTTVRCRCGHMDKEMPCSELTTRADDARCGKQCKAKRSCGRHKCGEHCCILIEHPCPLTCGQLLSCGLHRCEEPCHRGKCPKCPHVSFDELRCRCGAEVIYPPVACGVRPPECSRICNRPHACDHPVTHSCHSEEHCPPCTTLTVKTCYGGHEQRKNLACHIEGISCGKPCGARMPCGQHSCQRICHAGPCDTSCTQPCKVTRPCGHPCSAPCHPSLPCPDTPCATQVKLTCDCGNRAASVPCAEDSYSRVSTALLAARLQEEPINLSELGKNGKKLECNDECYKQLRNASLAEALQINNPEVRSSVVPRYSDALKEWVRKDPALCTNVHSKLADLVKLAQESKHKSRSYSFPNMNRDKRAMVHEYAQHFGITTQSFDAEPQRNVIATAAREKCSLPTVSLLEAAGIVKQRRPAQSSTSNARSGAGAAVTFTDLSKKKTEEVVDWFG